MGRGRRVDPVEMPCAESQHRVDRPVFSTADPSEAVPGRPAPGRGPDVRASIPSPWPTRGRGVCGRRGDATKRTRTGRCAATERTHFESCICQSGNGLCPIRGARCKRTVRNPAACRSSSPPVGPRAIGLARGVAIPRRTVSVRRDGANPFRNAKDLIEERVASGARGAPAAHRPQLDRAPAGSLGASIGGRGGDSGRASSPDDRPRCAARSEPISILGWCSRIRTCVDSGGCVVGAPAASRARTDRPGTGDCPGRTPPGPGRPVG